MNGGRPVVISGIGVVAAGCAGVGAFGDALGQGHLPLTAVDQHGRYHRPGGAALALLVDGLDLTAWVSPAAARRLSRPALFAAAAARMAVADAALPDLRGTATAVVMSTAFGAIAATEQIVRTAHLDGPEMVSPSVFPESVANAAGAHVAIAVGAHGPNLTLVRREAGALAALAHGAEEVSRGRAGCALVGAAEEMPPVLHAFLDRFAALARSRSGRPEAARPFDRHRNGFLAAEGASVLVIEPEERARARGARIYARVRAQASAFDPTASRVGWGHGGRSLGARVRGLLADAGVAPADVDRIVSGASGAVDGDRLEAETLTAAWSATPLPAMATPKRVTGEYGGGFLAAAVLEATGRGCPPDPDATPDTALPIAPPATRPHGPAALTLVSTLASGGAASWVLLEGAA